jgi:hypothetical protein
MGHSLNFSEIWGSLSGFNKIFFVLFCGVSTYTVYLSFHGLSVLHSLKKLNPSGSFGPPPAPIGALRKRLWNLRQLHLFVFLFFVFCVLVQVPGTFHVFSMVDSGWKVGGVISTLSFFSRAIQ